jgi:hypothetical protein
METINTMGLSEKEGNLSYKAWVTVPEHVLQQDVAICPFTAGQLDETKADNHNDILSKSGGLVDQQLVSLDEIAANFALEVQSLSRLSTYCVSSVFYGCLEEFFETHQSGAGVADIARHHMVDNLEKTTFRRGAALRFYLHCKRCVSSKGLVPHC